MVLAKEMRPATQNRGTSFAVRYRFTASDGALVEGRQPVDAERWEALREGGPIEIQHVAGNPALQRLAGQSERSEALTLFVVGGVLAGVGVCLFARGLRRGRRQDPLRSRVPCGERLAPPGGITMRRLRRLIDSYGFTAALIVTGIVFAVAAEYVAVVRDLVAFLDGHRMGLLVLTVGATVMGFTLFMAGVIHMVMTRGEVMTPKEIQDFSGRRRAMAPYAGSWSVYRFWGKAAGVQAEDQASFSEVKDAWRLGAWRHDVRWRYFFMMLGGGLAALFAGLGAVIVVAPPVVKGLLVAGLLYALMRLWWEFRQA